MAMARTAKQYYEFGPFRIDAAERLLLRGEEEVPLTPKVFDTLLVLVKNSGRILSGNPCLGSWVTYGLGSENKNLPGFVVMLDPTGGPISGAKNWSSGYMPACYQGTVLRFRPADQIAWVPTTAMLAGDFTTFASAAMSGTGKDTFCPRRARPARGSSTGAPRASASLTCWSAALRRWSMVRSRICRCTAGTSGCTRRIRGARPTG